MELLKERLRWCVFALHARRDCSSKFTVTLEDLMDQYMFIYKMPVTSNHSVASITKKALPSSIVRAVGNNDLDYEVDIDTSKLPQKGIINSAAFSPRFTWTGKACDAINATKRKLKPLIEDLVCPTCERLPVEPIYIGSCRHLFCGSCANAKRLPVNPSKAKNAKATDEGDSAFAKNTNCLECWKDTEIFQLDCSRKDVWGKLSAMIIWILHFEMPYACKECGLVNTLYGHLNKHPKCYATGAGRLVTTPGDIDAAKNLKLLLRHMIEVSLANKKGLMHTRVCAYFRVTKAFDPATCIRNEQLRKRLQRVELGETVELLAHPNNSMYGFCCVKLPKCALHRWLPTFCLIPRGWSSEEFASTLSKLNWLDITTTSAVSRPEHILDPL